MVGGAILLLALLFTVLQVKACSKRAEAEEKAEEAREAAIVATNPAPVAEPVKPEVIFAKTPKTLTIDYPYMIETTGSRPVLIWYNKEKEPERYRGSNCQKLRQPQYLGPKVFERDPEDPNKEEVAFRIYPITGEIPQCPP